jgi:hypothetical protein
MKTPRQEIPAVGMLLNRPDVASLAAEYGRTDYPVDGLEDVRLNLVDDDLVASATVRNLAPLDGTCRIATATVDHADAVSSARVTNRTPDRPEPAPASARRGR